MKDPDLKDLFLNTITSGLHRKSITTCSKWAEAYRILDGPPYPGRWRFKYFPWLKDMHDSEAEMNIGQKASQMGYTETMLNVVFYNIDIKRTDCLYVLPAKTPDAGDFSVGRFDSALEASTHLRNLFSDVKNVGHKRAGGTNLYIRGSRSRSGLKSVPVGVIILDEVDEMTQENIPLALQRTSGQLEWLAWLISTPTIHGEGINKWYNDSSQNHFFFKCPSCSRFIELKWPESIEINVENPSQSRLLCILCRNTLHHETKVDWLAGNEWVESHTDRDVKGWHISHLYSTVPSGDPKNITVDYVRAQNNVSDEQEFYNSKMALTHEVKGARVTEEMLTNCKGDYFNAMPRLNRKLVTMGVDVGNPWIHIEIDEWDVGYGSDINVDSKPRVIFHGKRMQLEELDDLMYQYSVNFCVIDAHPERRKAFEFASRFWGKVRLCFYVVGISGKQIHIGDKVEPTVSVDRTSWLDMSLGRFKNGSIAIPKNVDNEYKSNIKSLVRIYAKDKNGNPVGVYHNSDPDHYGHARNYAEIALPLAIGIGQHQSISSVV